VGRRLISFIRAYSFMCVIHTFAIFHSCSSVGVLSNLCTSFISRTVDQAVGFIQSYLFTYPLCGIQLVRRTSTYVTIAVCVLRLTRPVSNLLPCMLTFCYLSLHYLSLSGALTMCSVIIDRYRSVSVTESLVNGGLETPRAHFSRDNYQ
jgi:hypothetical protein